MTIEDLLDAGAFTAWLEKLDRVSCNVGRHWPDSVWATEFPVFSTSVTIISSLSLFSKVLILRQKLRTRDPAAGLH